MEVCMYVVTGATGHTGHIVATQLLANGEKVRAIGRSAERLQSIVGKGAEPFVADLTDKQALSKAFAGARGVYAMIPPVLPAKTTARTRNGSAVRSHLRW